MIVTVTLNPALHVGYEANRVSLGGANPVSRVTYRAGGQGLAVARVLHTFGHDVVAAGLAGGASGEVIRAELARAGVATQFTWITGESRRVLEVADESDGTVTTFGEPAPYITTEELGRLAADYRSLMTDATAAVLCGSLPDGLPAETYGSLTSYAVEAGVPVILNADGSALRHAVSRQPALVIPEAGASESEMMSAGAGAVVLMTGSGVRAVTAGREWRASVGSGAREPGAGEPGAGERATGRRDALVAGFVPGIALGWTWPDMLRHALALADSVTPDGEADLAMYEKLLPEVKVTGPRG